MFPQDFNFFPTAISLSCLGDIMKPKTKMGMKFSSAMADLIFETADALGK